MRNGKLLARDLNLVPMQDDFQEQIISFLVLFYQENTEPKELLVPKELDVSLLQEIIKCKIIKPQKGNKANLVAMANENAKEQLEKKFLLIQKNEASTIGAIKQLGSLLNITLIFKDRMLLLEWFVLKMDCHLKKIIENLKLRQLKDLMIMQV